jgi:lysophospholipase L1-like esterase
MRTYLALGDSYTIGEGVLPEENFPNQTVALLNKTADGAPSAPLRISRRQGFTQTPSRFSIGIENPPTKTEQADGGYYKFTSPEIIATTGFTTDELNKAVNEANISKHYDMVSLLIGVNNQYRGRSVENFEMEFEGLLQRAIQFANNKPQHVFVLSIPDWGVTPFAEGRDRKKIGEEIDVYNLVCKKIAEKFNTHFIDITTAQRMDGGKEEFLAFDKLHPSEKEYAKWARRVMDNFNEYNELMLLR